jgi:hypothetical protein
MTKDEDKKNKMTKDEDKNKTKYYNQNFQQYQPL